MNLKEEHHCWAIVWWTADDNCEGKRAWLIGTPNGTTRTFLFPTKRQATDYIRLKYGYIAKRKDLRSAPHGWRVPYPTRVKVTIEETL